MGEPAIVATVCRVKKSNISVTTRFRGRTLYSLFLNYGLYSPLLFCGASRTTASAWNSATSGPGGQRPLINYSNWSFRKRDREDKRDRENKRDRETETIRETERLRETRGK